MDSQGAALWEQYIKCDISFKKYLEKIQFSVSFNSTFSSNQIIGILFVSIDSLNTWLSISALRLSISALMN